MRTNHYLHADIDPEARHVAVFGLQNFVSRFPVQLSPPAISNSFALPQDVTQIGCCDITDAVGLAQQQYLFPAGWPCQDYSAAGRGRLGKGAALLHHVLRIVTLFQGPHSHRSTAPPAYCCFENVAPQHNFNHPHMRHVVTEQLQALLGKPMELDALLASPCAARLRNYWANLADQSVLQALIQQTAVPHGGSLYDILRPGRHPMHVHAHDSRNSVPGQPRRVWAHISVLASVT